MFYILYNKLSKSGKNKKNIDKVRELVSAQSLEITEMNVVEIKDVPGFINSLNDDDEVALVGGDGTVHYFADAIREHLPVKQNIYIYAAGTGNDFIRNINSKPNTLVKINEFLENLPLVTVRGNTSSFVNGCGIGVDAMVCQGVNSGTSDKNNIYALVALKSFLTYKPTNVEIVIDGETYRLNKCWVSVAMNAKCQGGGLPFAPDQNVGSDEITILALHNCCRLKVFWIFAHLIKGKHLKFKKNVFYKKGKNIKFIHSEVRPFQYDGEVVEAVSSVEIKTTK